MENKKAPATAMWICLGLGLLLLFIPFPGTVLIGGPLNLAAFILAILCLVRGQTVHGVFGLIGSTVGAGIVYLISWFLFAMGMAAAGA